MDEAARAIHDEQWVYTKAAIARAFEAFRHDPEHPAQYDHLFEEATAALKEWRTILQQQTAALRETQNRLLLEGAAEGLTRAARIERMQEVVGAAAQRAPHHETQEPHIRYGR